MYSAAATACKYSIKRDRAKINKIPEIVGGEKTVLKYIETALGIVTLICQIVMLIKHTKLEQELNKRIEMKFRRLVRSGNTVPPQKYDDKDYPPMPRRGGGAPDPNFSIPCPPKPKK